MRSAKSYRLSMPFTPLPAVVMVGDEDATVKRVYATGTTVTLMPQSTNPAHQPQIYDPAKTPVRIIGRVVRVEHDL